MISYVKIYGPPLFEALKVLQKIAIDMPEVCIMDTTLQTFVGSGVGVGASLGEPDIYQDQTVESLTRDQVMAFFGEEHIPKERCDTIINKSGQKLGDYDFFFEWFTKPNMEQIELLIKRIDEALEPLGVNYTLTTK